MTLSADTFEPLFIPNQVLETECFSTNEGCQVFAFTTRDTTGSEIHSDITLYCV